VIAAIVYWNTVYMERTAQHLRSTGIPVPDRLLIHVAPLGWEHISEPCLGIDAVELRHLDQGEHGGALAAAV
jgi:hypothetical protein